MKILPIIQSLPDKPKMPGSQASNKVRFDDKEMTLLLTIFSALGTTKQIWD